MPSAARGSHSRVSQVGGTAHLGVPCHLVIVVSPSGSSVGGRGAEELTRVEHGQPRGSRPGLSVAWLARVHGAWALAPLRRDAGLVVRSFVVEPSRGTEVCRTCGYGIKISGETGDICATVSCARSSRCWYSHLSSDSGLLYGTALQ